MTTIPSIDSLPALSTRKLNVQPCAAIDSNDVALLLPVHPVDGRHAFDSLDLLAVDADRRDDHEAIGVPIRRRREKHALDEAEDRSCRADADSQRERGERR